MKVLISGAGIAGLTLAYWLHQNGHTPVVVEKAPDINTTGYLIDFAGSGLDVAKRMGLIEALREKSLDMNRMVYKDSAGETTVALPLDKIFRAAHIDDQYFALNRRDLVEVLYRCVEAWLDIRFGTTVHSIRQSPDSVGVTYTNGGEEETFDLVVGADGFHSEVRELVFGEEREFTDFLGYTFAVFEMPSLPQGIEPGYVMHLEPNVQVGIYEIKPGRWLTFVAYKSEDEGHIPHEKRLETLCKHLNGVEWIVPQILDSLTPETPIFLDSVTQIKMPSWSSNRVVLLGDAAYCLTLISGQGASMAMAGAYFLAQELNRTSDYREAFAHYEKRLRPYIDLKQRKAVDFAPNFIPGSTLRINLTSLVLRLVDLPPFRRLVGKQFSLESIIDAA